MKNFKRNVDGITLIALVVTIIVLLILAGISIAMLTGENGILGRAGESRESTGIAEEKEMVNLAAIGARSRDDSGKLLKSNLITELDNLIGEGKYDLDGEGPFTVTYKESGRSYEVEGDSIIKEELSPGLYARDGSLIYDWQQLIDDGYITDSDNILNGINIQNLEGKLVIRTGVTEIAENAFNMASKIYEFNIPSTVTKIGNNAFKYTFKLEAITVAEDNPNFKSVDGVLFTKSMKTLLQYPEQKQGSTYIIPEKVEAIGSAAFSNNEVLEEITIGGKVKYIRSSAFYNENGKGYSKIKRIILENRC